MKLQVDPFFPDPITLQRVERAVNSGYLLVFPTETVYGIGCFYSDLAGIQRIFQLKQRPPNKPIALMFSTVQRVISFFQPSPFVQSILTALLPNPITVVFRKPLRVSVSSFLVSGEGEVGVRVPDHALALAIATLFRVPLALTSANRSGEKEPVCPEDISLSTAGEVLVVESGRTPLGGPSTVIRIQEETHAVLLVREGAYPYERICEVVKEIGANPSVN